MLVARTPFELRSDPQRAAQQRLASPANPIMSRSMPPERRNNSRDASSANKVNSANGEITSRKKPKPPASSSVEFGSEKTLMLGSIETFVDIAARQPVSRTGAFPRVSAHVAVLFSPSVEAFCHGQG
jgi:hypothetical protein